MVDRTVASARTCDRQPSWETTVALFAYIALFGWIPCVIIMFAILPRRQAAAIGVIGAWLFLPPYSFDIIGLPDFSKTSAASLGLLAGALIFSSDRLLAFRPRWFDLPMTLWCFSGMFASLANGMGPYDGLSEVLSQTLMWGLPYLFGRIYFGDPDSLLYFARAIVIGGLSFVLPCIYEMRMSPQIVARVYGSGPVPVMRLGGWRPNVFFATGLELGMWMTDVALTGWWLWRGGAIKRIGQYPFGQVVLPILMATTIICRSSGALALLFAGMGLLWDRSDSGRGRCCSHSYSWALCTFRCAHKPVVRPAGSRPGSDDCRGGARGITGISLQMRGLARVQGAPTTDLRMGGLGKEHGLLFRKIRHIVRWFRRTVCGSFSLGQRDSSG